MGAEGSKIGDFVEGDLKTTGDFKSAIEGSGSWDQVKVDWQNHFKQIGNMFGGDFNMSKTSDQMAQDRIAAVHDPNSYYNASNWQSVSSSLSNAAYSPQSGMGGTVKPSDLMKISDPTTKIASSVVRGNQSKMFNVNANKFNIQSSGNISSAVGGSGQTINSSGGTGPTISQDVKTNTGVPVNTSSSASVSVPAGSSNTLQTMS